MKIKKYPIEIEFTNLCWLKCLYCVNKNIVNKSYLSEEKYDLFLDYVYSNIDNILYINMAWIGDLFLHPKIDLFLLKFIKKFKNTNIDVLLSTKALNITKYINILKQFKLNNINLSISIGLFSFDKENYDKFTWVKWSFNKTLKSILVLRNTNIDFSLELLISKYSINSLKQFKIFWEKIWVNTIFHKLHNFWWRIDLKGEKLNYTWLKNYCDFSWEEYNSNDYYMKLSNCNFIPFIDINWFFNLCSLSAHKWELLIYNLDNIEASFKSYIWLVEYFRSKIDNECTECSLK